MAAMSPEIMRPPRPAVVTIHTRIEAVHFDTKMLLLHGRTGTGKSSFLRAGLFPRVFLNNPHFYVLTDRTTGEPLLIRSTTDPVGSIVDALLAQLLDPSAFEDMPIASRHEALALLKCNPGMTDQERAKGLMDALQSITSEIPGTFVLAIDQAEEVFTLDSRENETRRSAYFDFLESLCYRRLDIKVLLALRTEYYGQFADNFRLGPDLRVTKIHSGLDQFMLRGIQDAARLESAILRPTCGKPVAGLSPPYEKYRFTFEPGLARAIANDIVQHCGESSSLPVVQMVCLDLYEAIKSNVGSAEIRRSEYMTRGAVDGAIDRFITVTIRDAMAECKWTAKPHEIDGWRDILSSLVARQEGGALTSLLLPEGDLSERAIACRLNGPVRDCLNVMAQERFRLLRSMTLRDTAGGGHTVHYSLGHDALAPSLFQWNQERGKVIEEQERTKRAQQRIRRLKHRLAFTLLGLAGVVGLSTFFVSSAKASALGAVLKSVDAEPQARLRLLTLAALAKNTSWPERIFLPMDNVEKKLRATLHQTPILRTKRRPLDFRMTDVAWPASDWMGPFE